MINGRLTLGGEYSCLVVPAAPILPKDIVERINDLAAEGLRVIYVDLATKGAVGGEVIRLKELGSELSSLATVKVENELPLLRIMHCRRDESEQIMLVNEDAVNTARGEIALPFVGEYTLILPQFKKYFACRTDDGRVSIELPPFTSAVVISGPACGEALPELCELGEIDTTWNISLAQYDSMESFLPYRGTSELFNVSRVLPRFSGKIRYEAEIELDKATSVISLGNLGHNAKLRLNGIDCGLRFAPPYVFDVEGAVREGKNKIEITVANTLLNSFREHFSGYMQMPPSGLCGPIKAYSKK